ncbi:MAG: Crp/Fnr family transcriptional regulator [Bacteroidota bacterium]|nr:Crp/Fnr family transcriptional regulator [Bacteroidota bacterium]
MNMITSNILSSCTVSNTVCKCFDKLTKEETELVDNNSVTVNFNKGEFICKQGTFASHVMFVEEGLAKIYIEGKNDNLILKIIPEGNLVGLTSIFEGNTIFQYSSTAYINSLIKLIDINVFRKLTKTNAEFASEVINILTENNLQIYGRFFCLARKQSYGRLADIILCLSERIYKSYNFELLLTRKDLAELTGMSTENVIRMLKKFKDEGLIDIKGKQFTVNKPETLMKISENG